MKLFKKSSTPSKPSIGRVASMDDQMLNMWADTLLMQLGAAFDKHRYHGESHELVTEYLTAFDTVWTELRSRSDRPS
jgi:hypothetical protein